MPATIAQARDQILALAKAVADANSVSVVWEGMAADKPADNPVKSWVRIGLRHVGRRQANLAGADATRRYTSTGFLVMALFTPASSGLSLADSLSSAFRNGVEGKTTSGGVWFRNARTIEQGLEGSWWRTDVLADFEYDEIR